MLHNIQNKEYLSSIDGFRALAVLGVLLFHFELGGIHGGFVGVDVFFVISGFLITRNIVGDLKNNTFSFSSFYHRRFMRLLPAAFTTSLATIILCALLFSPEHLKQAAHSLVASTLSLANLHFWDKAGYFDIDSIWKPLLHFWSLSIEEQFYLFWPIILVWLLSKLKKRIYVNLTFISLVIISLIASELTVQTDPNLAFYWLHTRAWEFLVGAILAINQKTIFKFISSSNSISLIGTMMIVSSMLLYSEKTLFPGLSASIPTLGVFLLLASNRSYVSEIVYGNRLATFLGKISYSVYLVHWPIWVTFNYWKGGPIETSEKFLLILVTLLGSLVLYAQVEDRFRLKSSGSQTEVKANSLKLILSAASLIVLSYILIFSNGAEFRITNTQKVDLSKLINPGSCSHVHNEDSRIKEKKCVFGADNAKHKILLIGDSHAEHLRYGFDYFAKRNKVAVHQWTFSGCPPVWDTYKIYGLAGSNESWKQSYCKELINKWRSHIATEKYTAVVISARWMWMYEPLEYGDGRIKRRDFLVDTYSPVFSVDAAAKLFSRQIRKTVEEISKGSSTKVIIFSQVPLLGKNIQDCDNIPKFLFTNSQINMRCEPGVSYLESLGRLSFTNQTLRSLKSDTVLPIIPSDFLCSQNRKICRTLIDSQLAYLDDNHLNLWGSYSLIEYFEKDLKEFLDFN